MNLQIVRCEDRPDQPEEEIVFRLVDLFTTRDGKWEPDPGLLGSVQAWARQAYLRSTTDPDYFDDAGGDHHLFARAGPERAANRNR
ncbi:MAG: hypothetical protein R2844_15880 [Caldilineales bacterium]